MFCNNYKLYPPPSTIQNACHRSTLANTILQMYLANKNNLRVLMLYILSMSGGRSVVSVSVSELFKFHILKPFKPLIEDVFKKF